MLSSINALRFASLPATPAAQPALRFAAANDSFVSRVRFGDDEELEDGKDDTEPDVVITDEDKARQRRAVKIERDAAEHAAQNQD